MPRFPRARLLALALLCTALNAVKPLTIDDAAYYYYARQAAHRPLDPYGFAVFWWSEPEEANQVLAPPLLAYAWAPALRLSADNSYLWKMGLFPFAALFAFALHDLGRRLARGLETPLVVMTLLSPTFLPSLNLMLDVPALSLSLAALAVFARAAERASFGLAALAGFLAGLGMETKYTGVTAPAVLLLYALCFGGLRCWLVAAAAAAQVFVTWEFLTALLYGEAHFFFHARLGSGTSLIKWHNFRYLIPIAGSVAWPGTLLALVGLGVRWRGLLAAVALHLAAFALVACFDTEISIDDNFFMDDGGEKYYSFLPLEQLAFGSFGVALLAVSAAVVARLLFRWPGSGPLTLTPQRRVRGACAARFLVLWLILEFFAYLALTPFPAVRRVMALVVVGTFAAGRLAALRCRLAPARPLARAAVAYSVVLGFGYYAIDLIDARAQEVAAREAARRVRDAGGGDAWYVGHWGFQHYAEREGMKPIVPADMPADNPIPLPPRSLFRAGDWLVLPRQLDSGAVTQQLFRRDPDRTEYAFSVVVSDRLPWHTVVCFYGGSCGVGHHDGPRVAVDVYRVTADHLAGR